MRLCTDCNYRQEDPKLFLIHLILTHDNDGQLTEKTLQNIWQVLNLSKVKKDE